MELSPKTKKAIKLTLVIIFYIGLYYVSKGHFEKLDGISSEDIKIEILPLVAAILLVPANWWLESLKWKAALRPVEQVTTKQAVRGVLKGIPPSIFTPNRVGEAIGRPSVLKKENKLSGMLATGYCGLSQMPIMMICGVLACIYFKFYGENFQDYNFLTSWWFIAVGLIAALMLMAVYLFPKYTIPYVKNSEKSKGLRNKLQFFCNYEMREKWKLFLLSLTRYIVYSTQNYLSIKAFGIDINYIEGLNSVFLIYALMSFVPRPALAELGVRCSATVLVLRNYTDDFTSPTISSVFIWTINLLIPAIYGSVLYLQEKKDKKNS